MNYWVVRFDYEKQLWPKGSTQEQKLYRCTARLGVAANTITEAIDAIRTKEAEYPKAVVWAVSHQGKIDLTA